MIPLRLTLSNFLSYGEAPQTLDFTQFKIACLMGANGMGKSALLDALTWVLWGEARKASAGSATKHIMRNDTQKTFVEFDFEVDGNFYRVRRSATRTKDVKEKLDFYTIDAEANIISSLSEGSKTDTEGKIKIHIGLDYETFLNSAYLAQGKADEFTKKKATERIGIIRKVLDLDRYLPYEEEAKNRLRKIKDNNNQLMAVLERLDAEISQEATRKEELLVIEAAFLEKETALAAAKEVLEKLQKEQAEIRQKTDKVDNLKESVATYQQQIAEQQLLITKENAAILKIQSLQEQAATIEIKYQEYKIAQKAHQVYNDKYQIFNDLQSQIHQEEQQLQAEKSRLEADFNPKNLQLTELNNRVKQYQIQFNQLETAQLLLERCLKAELYRQEQDVKQKETQKLKDQIIQIETQISSQKSNIIKQISEYKQQISLHISWKKQLADAQKSLKVKQSAYQPFEVKKLAKDALYEEGMGLKNLSENLLKQEQDLKPTADKIAKKKQLMENTPDGDCPTCGSVLDENHRKKVLAEYDAQLLELTEKAAELKRQMLEATVKRQQLGVQFKELEAEVKLLETLPTQIAILTTEIQNLEIRLAESTDLSHKMTELEALISGDFKELRAQIESFKTQITSIGFNQATYDSALALIGQKPNAALAITAATEAEIVLKDLLPQQLLLEESVTKLQTQLSNNDFGHPFRAKLSEFKKLQSNVGFDALMFDKIKQEEALLRPFQEKYEQLASAATAMQGHQQILENTKVQIANFEAQIDGLNLQIAAESVSAEVIEALTQNLLSTQNQLKTATEERERCIKEKAGKVEQLRQIEEKKFESDDIQQKNKDLTENIKVHEGLATAFGRNGIPIIEIHREAPQIEEYANEMLQTLRSSSIVRIDTQKEKATGGKINALEIYITDEFGNTRPYEMFSGGEAFRINFALRIALAYALAARKGIQVRTLIIDEGFGTLDQEGIQAMRDAIYAIQERFDKILIITHLEELKDAFPTRIQVHKEVSGSVFTVV